MKRLFFRGGVRLVLLVLFLKSLTALAQVPDLAGANSAMIKLFGDNPSFTAQAEVRVFGAKNVEWLRMPSVFASADTKLRVDVDIKLIRSSSMQASMVDTFKKFGMDRITSVIRPDKRATYIIYPGAKAYASIALSPEDAQIAGQKLERKPLGRETLDGHPCVKNLSTVKSSKGAVLIQATTWNATDLRDFPIQIQTAENGNTTVMHFQSVNLAKPDPRLFDVPAGFKQIKDPQELMNSPGGQQPPAATRQPASPGKQPAKK
jgi:hypothetical protein